MGVSPLISDTASSPGSFSANLLQTYYTKVHYCAIMKAQLEVEKMTDERCNEEAREYWPDWQGEVAVTIRLFSPLPPPPSPQRSARSSSTSMCIPTTSATTSPTSAQRLDPSRVHYKLQTHVFLHDIFIGGSFLRKVLAD